jgi:subtilisin family serine protease
LGHYTRRSKSYCSNFRDRTKTDHPEFSGRLVTGYDFVNNDNDPTDDFGHGTNVTGIALAKGNNEIGYAGVN